jgi:A/G-specific adenine glycosylase
MTDRETFAKRLLQWYDPSRRPLPWKGALDPYLVWLSEIILQQTRVEQGWAYFERFKSNFPTVGALAAAGENEVMKLWEGLGYYARARNMHAAAKHIVLHFGGHFPSNYKDIRALKGVGDYTAAAVASFAFGLPHAVVDGNVFRVLSRCFAIETPIDTTEGKRLFANLATELLDKQRPADYNQAIMDFGALVCTPHAPNCLECPVSNICRANLRGSVAEFPVKSKKLLKKERFFNFLVIHNDGELYVRKRQGKDIWQGLYEFPLVESSEALEGHFLAKYFFNENIFIKNIDKEYKIYNQNLTHQKICAQFMEFSQNKHHIDIPNDWELVHPKDLAKLAFPKIIKNYLDDNNLFVVRQA